MSIHYVRTRVNMGNYFTAVCAERDCPFEYQGYDYKPIKQHVKEQDHDVRVGVERAEIWKPSNG